MNTILKFDTTLEVNNCSLFRSNNFNKLNERKKDYYFYFLNKNQKMKLIIIIYFITYVRGIVFSREQLLKEAQYAKYLQIVPYIKENGSKLNRIEKIKFLFKAF